MRIYLIRHGETDYTINKQYCGFSNPPLNEMGIKTANILKKYFQNKPINKIYSSDLIRAIETTKIIFPHNKFTKTKLIREMNFGIFEGYDYQYLSKKYTSLYQKWISNPNTTIPKGETFSQFKKRIKKFFNKLIECDKNNNIAIVSHGGVIRLLICEAKVIQGKLDENYSYLDFWNINVDCGSIFVIEWMKNKKIKIRQIKPKGKNEKN